MPPLPSCVRAHPPLMCPCPASNISIYLTSRTSPPARPTNPPAPAAPTRPASPRVYPSGQPAASNLPGQPARLPVRRTRAYPRRQSRQYHQSHREPLVPRLGIVRQFRPSGRPKLTNDRPFRSTCRAAARQSCTMARQPTARGHRAGCQPCKTLSDRSRLDTIRIARGVAGRKPPNVPSRHATSARVVAPSAGPVPFASPASCAPAFLAGAVPSWLWGGIHMPSDLRVDMIESMFDNRRGGERACGNQVDGDQATWAVRGPGDSRCGRSRAGRSWSRCSRAGCPGLGALGLGCLRSRGAPGAAGAPRSGRRSGAGGVAGAAGVARAAAAGASSRDGGGGGGVRPAVPGAGRGRVSGRSLVRDRRASRGRGAGGGRPRPGHRADPAGTGSRPGLAAGDGVAARRVRARLAAPARAGQQLSKQSSGRPRQAVEQRSSRRPGRRSSQRSSRRPRRAVRCRRRPGVASRRRCGADGECCSWRGTGPARSSGCGSSPSGGPGSVTGAGDCGHAARR